MIRILFFIEELRAGGAEKVLCNLVNSMDQSRFDITVQTLWPCDAAAYLKPGIRYRSCYPSNNAACHLLSRAEAALGLTYTLHIKGDYDIEVAYLECGPTKIMAGSTNRNAKKLAWVINAWQIIPYRYPKLGERVTVGTLPYEFQKFIGYRNFVMLDEAGNYLAKANTVWSLINMETGKPVIATPEILSGYPIEERIPMEYADRKIAVPEGGEKKEEILVMPHHLDTNHHVNNGQYVLMAQSFLPEPCTVKQLRVEYKKQAFLGDVLYPYVVIQGSKYIVSLQNEEGKGYATVEFDIGS